VTRIDFYILEHASHEARLTLACRLAAKAVQQDLEVLINAATDADGRRLDELLMARRPAASAMYPILWKDWCG
jgi:DNA polymerase IIIc chi subunit